MAIAEQANQSTIQLRPNSIDLTPDQKELIKQATGMEVAELELTPEALEERVAPVGGTASVGTSCACYG